MNATLREIGFRIAFAAGLIAAAAAIVVLFVALTASPALADTPPPILNVSVIVDTTYVDEVGEVAARARVTAIMDQVIDIYRQVPLQVVVARVDFNHIVDDSQPFYLNQAIARARAANPYLYDTCLTLFFTDRRIAIGESAYYGYSNDGPVCTANATAIISLTTVDLDGPVAAHEMAHIFGVPHDGFDACASTPASGYLMQGLGFGGIRFSQCSLDVLHAAIKNASCLTSQPQNVIASTPPPVQKSGGGSFDGTILFVLAVFVLWAWLSGRTR